MLRVNSKIRYGDAREKASGITEQTEDYTMNISGSTRTGCQDEDLVKEGCTPMLQLKLVRIIQ